MIAEQKAVRGACDSEGFTLVRGQSGLACLSSGSRHRLLPASTGQMESLPVPCGDQLLNVQLEAGNENRTSHLWLTLSLSHRVHRVCWVRT